MSQSQEKQIDPAASGQIKTMFATEGQPTTILVTVLGNQRRDETYWFPHPMTALQWCLKNGAGFVFSRALPNVAGN